MPRVVQREARIRRRPVGKHLAEFSFGERFRRQQHAKGPTGNLAKRYPRTIAFAMEQPADVDVGGIVVRPTARD